MWLASHPATRTAALAPRLSARVTMWWVGVLALGITTASVSLAPPWLELAPDPRTGTITAGLDEYRYTLTATALANSSLTVGWTIVGALTHRVSGQITAWQDRAAAPPVPPAQSGEAARPANGIAVATILAVLAWVLAPVQIAGGLPQVITPPLSYASWLLFLQGALLAVGGMVVAGTLTMIWQSQARAEALRVAGPDAVPGGWTVAAWVLPGAHLAVPAWLTYRLLQPAGGHRSAGAIALVATWWTTWLGAWTCSWVTFLHCFSPQRVQAATMPAAAWTTAGVWAVCAVLFAVIVALVRRRQPPVQAPAQ